MSEHAPGCPAFRSNGDVCSCGARKRMPTSDPRSPLVEQLRALVEDMRKNGADLAIMSDETNGNAQQAAEWIAQWANRLDALLGSPPAPECHGDCVIRTPNCLPDCLGREAPPEKP